MKLVATYNVYDDDRYEKISHGRQFDKSTVLERTEEIRSIIDDYESEGYTIDRGYDCGGDNEHYEFDFPDGVKLEEETNFVEMLNEFLEKIAFAIER